MTANGRARIQYRMERGFVAWDNSRWQISVQVHNRDTYLAGVTYVPTAFYLNLPEDMKNLPKRIEKAKASKKSVKEKGLFEAGAGLSIKSEAYTLYTNKNGVKGYFERTTSKGKETWHYDVRAWSRIMEIAQDHANVKPEILSIGNLESATLEWPSGDLGLYDGTQPQSQTIADAKSLNKLKKMFGNVKYGSGSGCPFSAYLTL
ncbi:MAG: hypothetical protein Q4D04_02165, partial [Clostridia bacterium]|nr:hypothetical protein [Clostridia bacterium]